MPTSAPAELRLGADNAQEHWSLVAAAARGAWDPFEPRGLATPRFDPRDAFAGEAGTARVAFDWRKAPARAGLDFALQAQRRELQLRSDSSLASSALDERFAQRDRRTDLGALLRASEARGLLGLPGRRAFEVRAASSTLDARGFMGNAFNGALDDVRRDRVRESGLALTLRQDLSLARGWRLEGAMEARAYRWSVDSELDRRAGAGGGWLPAWSAGLSGALGAGHQVFARAAHGEPGRDGRLAAIDPRSGAPLPWLDPAATQSIVEAGWRVAPAAGLQAGLSLFRARTESELRFTGQQTWSAIARAGVRSGVRASVRYEPSPWLALDAAATFAKPRFGDGAAEPIPGAAQRLATAGATLRGVGGWTARLFVSYLGPQNPVDEETTRVRTSTVVNAQLAHNLSKATRVTFDVFNVFNQPVGGIDAFAAARLHSEPGAVENFLFHPGEPRTFRLRLRTTF